MNMDDGMAMARCCMLMNMEGGMTIATHDMNAVAAVVAAWKQAMLAVGKCGRHEAECRCLACMHVLYMCHDVLSGCHVLACCECCLPGCFVV